MAEPTVTQPSLECLPPMVLDKIVKDNDYKEIVDLRLVCQKLKEYVDVYRPDFHLKYIMVNAITSGFLVHFGTNMADLKKKNYEKTVMSVDGDSEMWRPLEAVLLHQKSVLEVLQLNCSLEENIEGYGKILEKIQTILTSQNHQLQVKCFKIHAQNEDQVMKILPYLDPSSLKSILMKNQLDSGMSESDTFMEIQNLKELPQWKNIKTFRTQNLLIDAQIEDFGDFKSLTADLNTIKTSDVVKLKEKISNSPMGHSAYIKYRNLDRDVDIPEEIPPNGKTAIFKYPTPHNNNTYLKVELSEDRIYIRVYETRLEDVFDEPMDW